MIAQEKQTEQDSLTIFSKFRKRLADRLSDILFIYIYYRIGAVFVHNDGYFRKMVKISTNEFIIQTFDKKLLRMEVDNMKLIILGAPGSGKGTSATYLREKYNLAHISTGDIFRANIKGGTPLGIEAKSYIDKGQLVPDSLTVSMVEDRLSQDDCKKGYILDGFPRTIAQAEALDEMLSKKGEKIDAVLSIIVDDETIKGRVSGRRVCEKCGESYNVTFRPTKVEGVCDACGGNVVQRDDDKPETVEARLKTYYANTQPLIDFYDKKGIIIEGDNNKNPDICREQLEAGLKAKGLI